jgi:hypothetical protein
LAWLFAQGVDVHRIQAPNVAANDNFSDAIEITSDESFLHARFAGTTVEAGEPQVISGAVQPGEPTFSDRTAGNSVWYYWTAPCEGDLRAAAPRSSFGISRRPSFDSSGILASFERAFNFRMLGVFAVGLDEKIDV